MTVRHHHTAARRPAVTLAATALAATALVLAPASADAHVSVSADTTAAGASAVVTLNVPHGCEGSPTTRIALRVPAGINDAIPTVNPGWTVTRKTEKLATPITLEDGDQISSRVREVVWTARTPLPEGYRDTLSLQVALPEDAVGQQLAFPTVQTCVDGATGWTQLPAAGQEAEQDELEHPAPTVTVTAAEATDGHGTSTADTGTEDDPTQTTAGPQAEADLQVADAGTNQSGLGVAGLVTGLLGLVAGVTALVRSGSGRRAATPAPIDRT